MEYLITNFCQRYTLVKPSFDWYVRGEWWSSPPTDCACGVSCSLILGRREREGKKQKSNLEVLGETRRNGGLGKRLIISPLDSQYLLINPKSGSKWIDGSTFGYEHSRILESASKSSSNHENDESC